MQQKAIHIFTVIVFVLTSVSAKDQNIKLIARQKGTSVQLLCSSENEWLKDGEVLFKNITSRVNVVSSDYNNALVIKYLHADHEGIYVCGNSTYRIEIVEPLKLEASRKFIKVHLFEPVKIRCSFKKAKHMKNLVILWFINNQRIFPNNRFTIYQNSHQGTLVVENVTILDAGVIECRGGPLHNLSEAQDVIKLNVTYSPFITTHLPQVWEEYTGATVTLTCNVLASPSPKFNWVKHFKNGSKIAIGNDKKLVLHKVTLNDVAVYACTARNVYGKAKTTTKFFVKETNDKIVVNLKNNFDRSRQFLFFSILYGNFDQRTAKIECSRVTKGKKKKFHYAIEAQPKSFYIVIDDLYYHHAGMYQCNVTAKSNGRVFQQSVKNLDVVGSPEAVSKVTAFYNSSHLLASVELPANRSIRPYYAIEAVLWRYNLDLNMPPELLSTRNFTKSKFAIVSNNNSLSFAALALEISTIGNFGRSSPVLSTPQKMPALKQNQLTIKNSEKTLTFPQTEVVIVSNTTASIGDCFELEDHVLQKLFRRGLKLDNNALKNFVMREIVLKSTFKDLHQKNVTISEKESLVIGNLYTLKMNLSRNTLPEAIRQFREVKSAVENFGIITADSCKIKIEFGCIFDYCSDSLNGLSEKSTEAGPTDGALEVRIFGWTIFLLCLAVSLFI